MRLSNKSPKLKIIPIEVCSDPQKLDTIFLEGSSVLTGKIVKFGLVRQILTRFQPQVLNLSN